jgi:hypothetical protein
MQTTKSQLALKKPAETQKSPLLNQELTALTVQIPVGIHRALKQRAADEGKKIREVLLEILCSKAAVAA